jgi:hypothetical protein
MKRTRALFHLLLPTLPPLLLALACADDPTTGGNDGAPPDAGTNLPDARVVTPTDPGTNDETPPPTLSNVSPPSGSERGGARVTLRGTFFVEPAEVFFADVPATSFAVLDEVSIAGPTIAAEVRGGEVAIHTITPPDLGLATFPTAALAGGDAADNARILRAVLEGSGTPAQGASVAANAGAEIRVGGAAASWREGVDRAREILASGRAARLLDAFIDTTQALAAGGDGST